MRRAESRPATAAHRAYDWPNIPLW